MLMLGNLCAKNRLVMSGFYCMDWCFVWSLWSCVHSFIHSFTRHKVIIKYVDTQSSRWHDNQAYNIGHNNRNKIYGDKEPAYAPVACLTFFTVTIILYILGCPYVCGSVHVCLYPTSLQFWCIWGQRGTDHILRSKGQSQFFLWRYEPVRRTGKSDDWLTVFLLA